MILVKGVLSGDTEFSFSFKQIWIDFFKKLSMIAYQQADRVTTLFEVNRALQIELHCPAEKIERIPNGVSCIEYEKIWQMRCSKKQRHGDWRSAACCADQGCQDNAAVV